MLADGSAMSTAEGTSSSMSNAPAPCAQACTTPSRSIVLAPTARGYERRANGDLNDWPVSLGGKRG
jgi:hypothetical protein